MRAQYAKQLHSRDEVEVRIGPGNWIPGYVISNPSIRESGVYVDVQTRQEGFLAAVHHLDLR
jgi:hypothetical protein